MCVWWPHVHICLLICIHQFIGDRGGYIMRQDILWQTSNPQVSPILLPPQGHARWLGSRLCCNHLVGDTQSITAMLISKSYGRTIASMLLSPCLWALWIAQNDTLDNTVKPYNLENYWIILIMSNHKLLTYRWADELQLVMHVQSNILQPCGNSQIEQGNAYGDPS